MSVFSRTTSVEGKLHIPRETYKAEIRDLYRRRPLTFFDSEGEEPVIGTSDERYVIYHLHVPYPMTPEGEAIAKAEEETSTRMDYWRILGTSSFPVARVGEWVVLDSTAATYPASLLFRDSFVTFVEAWRALDGHMTRRGE